MKRLAILAVALLSSACSPMLARHVPATPTKHTTPTTKPYYYCDGHEDGQPIACP